MYRFASTLHAPMFRMFDPRAAYFDAPIHHLSNTGVLQHYFNMLTPFKEIKEHEDSKADEVTLTLEHFILIFLICAIGLVSAIIVFIHEFLKREHIKETKTKIYQSI